MSEARIGAREGPSGVFGVKREVHRGERRLGCERQVESGAIRRFGWCRWCQRGERARRRRRYQGAGGRVRRLIWREARNDQCEQLLFGVMAREQEPDATGVA